MTALPPRLQPLPEQHSHEHAATTIPVVTTLPFAAHRHTASLVIENISRESLHNAQVIITRGFTFDHKAIGTLAPGSCITVDLKRYQSFPNARIAVQWHRAADQAAFVWSTTVQ